MPEEILTGVYRLPSVGSRVFALIDDHVTLIDTGGRFSRGRILNALRDLGRAPSDIGRILITHYHVDHWGALKGVVRDQSVQVFAPLREAAYLRGEKLAPIAAANRPRLARLLTVLFSHLLAPPSAVDSELSDGETLPVLGGLMVVDTPGHTAGHISFFLPELRMVLSGDAVQVNREGRLIAPTLYEDYESAVASLGRLANLDFDILVPSHFEPQRDGVREQLLALASGPSSRRTPA